MDNNLHPILAQMCPSPHQTPAITSRGVNVAVTAGAGTGKTTTLVARYLSLLEDEDLPPRSIVAITFTVKAAREMRNRIRREISRYLSTNDLDNDERNRWERRHNQLDAARIGTIHSLCAEILRSHPAEAEIDPDFEVLDEGIASVLCSQAVEQTMAWAASTQRDSLQAGAASLYLVLGVGGLKQLLSTLLARRLEARTAFDSLPLNPWASWTATSADHMNAFIENAAVLDGFEALKAPLRDGTIGHAAELGDALVPILDNLMRIWREIETAHATKDWAALSVLLSELPDYLKLKGRKSAWEPHRPKEIISELKDLYQKHLSWIPSEGISLALDQQVSEALPLLRLLFSHVQDRYNLLKEQRRALDFDDLEQGALDLLANPSSAGVLRRWQQEVRALLVDEFQDTNHRQRQIVRLLNGEDKKLFLVGDALQSIYRFRGADVTVFCGERERIANEGGETHQLSTSYRAHAPLLQNLNDLLRPVLGETKDTTRPWAVPFTALEAHREDPPEGLPAPHIELHLAVGTKKSGALERAAQALAGRLVDLVDAKQIMLPESSKADSVQRPLNYGDIAILCRASTSFGAYEDALESAGVPYVTVAGRGFYDRPEIRDLLNLLLALADPSDDLVLAGALRSPAFALSDIALFHLTDRQRVRNQPPDFRSLHHDNDHVAPEQNRIASDLSQARNRLPKSSLERPCKKRLPSLWEMVLRRGSDLPHPDGQRAIRAIDIINTLRSAIGRTTVAEVLKATLDATGYRAMLHLAGMQRAVRNVDKLLADAHTSRMVSVGEFLEYIRTLRDIGTREGEARAIGEGAIQIMTVHAAKGLEFPIVVLGDLTYRSSGDSPYVLTDPARGLLLRLTDEDGRRPIIYQLGLTIEKDKEDAESRRLLYVAATRAKEMLLLNACVNVSDKGKLSASGWLKWLADGAVLGLTKQPILMEEQDPNPSEIPLKLNGNPVRCLVYPSAYSAPVRATPQKRAEAAEKIILSPLLAQPKHQEPTEETDAQAANKEEPVSRRVWRVVPRTRGAKAPATVVGELVHAALEQWRFPDESFDSWAEAQTRRYGLTDARQIRNAQNEARRILKRFRAHSLYTEMDSARRLHEVPYSIEVEGKVDAGIIDALYQGDDGQWKLVEFKTDRISNEAALQRHLTSEEYEEQTLRYAKAVERLLGQRPRILLCFLNCWDGVRVREIQAPTPIP
ncbi:MAG: UvrD-helicase domain-containing protein [Chloroflexota bacterium]